MKLDKAAPAQANGGRNFLRMNAFLGLLKRVTASARLVAASLVRVVHYLYLSRVPLIGLVLLAALPLLATGPARTLVLGAYDLQSATPLYELAKAVWTALALAAVAASVFVTARIVWSHSDERFGLDYLRAFAPALAWLWSRALAAAVLVNMVWVLRASPEKTGTTLALALGLLMGGALAWLLGRVLRWGEKELSSAKVRDWLLEGAETLGLDREPGYLEPDDGQGGKRDFAAGHASSLAYSIMLAAAYWVLIRLEIPALVAVLMLVALAVFFLSGLAFFLDRYRVPLLLCIAAYCSVMQLWRTNDHYYRIWPAAPRPAAEPAVTPAAVVAKAMEQHRPLVVVASAGGGIQAAAWTTAVLARIGEELKGVSYCSISHHITKHHH